MNKIESARIIVKQNGDCVGIDCKECFATPENCGCGKLVTVSWTERKIKHAKAYIDRHEGKSKKKDHIRDTTKKVEEPKPVEEPTPLEIAKMIRDNGYKCAVNLGVETYTCEQCPLDVTKIPQLCGSGFKEDTRDYAMRIKLIDDYISANEPTVKENLTVPQPIKFEDPVPEYVYTITQYGIFKFAVARYHREETKVKDGPITYKELVFAFEGDKCLDGTKRDVTIDINNCYRTLEEAVMVAKKLWQGEKK